MMGQSSLRGLGLFLGLMAAIAAPAMAQDFQVIEERPEAAVQPVLPDHITLKLAVSDEMGAPVAGAAVHLSGREFYTDADGFVALPPTTPTARLEIIHPDHVTVTRTAADLYAEDGGVAAVVLPRYRYRFEVTPEGGVYDSGDVRLEVPEGAVGKAVTVRAARLPLSWGFDDTSGVQPDKALAFAFAPAGLKFKKPIRLRLPATGPVAARALYVADPESGRFQPAAGAGVEADATAAILTLSHFSTYAAGDPAEGVTRSRLGRSVDANGDKKLTAQDADLVVILWEGTHSAEWEQSVTSETSVMRASESGSTSTKGETTSVSGGISFGGVGVEVEHEVSKETATEIAKKVEAGTSSSRTETRKRSLAAGEYEHKCAYFLTIYDYWRVRTWRKHTPSDSEQKALEDAYDGRSDTSDDWGYFRIDGSQSIAVGRTLYGGNHVAVRKNGGAYEIYVQTGNYVVRTYAGFRVAECDPGNVGQAVKDDGGFFGGGQGFSDASFRPTAGGYRSIRYLGWGTGDEPPQQYDNMECGVEASDTLTIVSGFTDASEESEKKSTTKSSTTGVKVSAEGELPGGLGLSGGAGYSTASSEARSTAQSYAKQFMNQKETKIGWTIHNAHQPHLSNHLLYKLVLFVEVRDWKQTPRDKLPRDVRAIPSMHWRWSGSTGFAETENGPAMRDENGNFYLASAPVITKRDIGMALVRIKERPCGTPTTTGGPDTTTPTGDDKDKMTPTPSGGKTTPTPDVRPPVITPGHAGAGQEQSALPPQRYETTRVEFTAIAGATTVNPSYVGDLDRVEFVAVDGRKMDKEPAGATVARSEQAIKVVVPAAAGVALVRLIGSTGTVEVAQAATADAAPPGVLWPRDGMVDLRSGKLKETFNVPPAVASTAANPGDYRVTVGDQPVGVVAAKDGQIACTGSDLAMTPASGEVPVEITAPGGTAVKAMVPAWSYRVVVEPVTEVGAWYPIHVQVTGLMPTESVVMRFVPSPAQTIEPTDVTIAGSQAVEPVAVGQFQTTQIGPQAISVQIVKDPGPR